MERDNGRSGLSARLVTSIFGDCCNGRMTEATMSLKLTRLRIVNDQDPFHHRCFICSTLEVSSLEAGSCRLEPGEPD